MKSQELCEYLERLRAARNISQELFTNGIVSLRQYRRYLNGESDIPFQILDSLTEKLGIQTINLLRELETARIKEAKLIDRFYNHVVNYAYIEVEKFMSSFNPDTLVDNENKLFYQHAVNLYRFYEKKISNEDLLCKIKKLINYPKILKQSVFTEIELLIISSLLDFIVDEQESKLLYGRLGEYLNDNRQAVNISTTTTYNTILHRFAKYSGIQKNYDDVIKYCKIGIDRNLYQKSFYLSDYFHYFSALASYRLEKFEDYAYHLSQCYTVIQYEGNIRKMQKFTNLINVDFNIEFKDFVLEYLKQNKEE